MQYHRQPVRIDHGRSSERETPGEPCVLANECPQCGTANPYVAGRPMPARCCGCGCDFKPVRAEIERVAGEPFYMRLW